jgi:hypothetical protein
MGASTRGVFLGLLAIILACATILAGIHLWELFLEVVPYGA